MNEIYPRSSAVSYIYLGVEFYLLGRFAFNNHLIPTAAIMFHHSIERLLLSELAVGKTRKEMQSRYKDHRLSRYWRDYKELASVKNSEALDEIVERLDQAMKLRFLELDSIGVVFMEKQSSIPTMSN